MTRLALMKCMILFAVGLYTTECMVYHVAFLGRTSGPSGGTVGELHYQGTTKTPTVTNEVGCIWTSGGVTSHIRKLVPGGNCQGLVPNGDIISSSGVKVESSEDFVLHVYQSDTTGALADGSLAIPDEHLGTEYYVVTYCSLGGFCQFAVTGTADKTSVNIVFPRTISPASIYCNGVNLPENAPTGEPIAFLLNENQVLHIESTGHTTDLSGTYISSDHKVAVFVGARDVPSISGTVAFMYEQIPPTNKWGTDFVVAPNYLNDAGDIIKIVTKSDQTTIHILGFSPVTISTKGESVEWRIDWEMQSTVIATKPVLVVQVMSIDLYNDTNIVTGSPAMVLVPHIEQWTDSEIYSNCLQKAENQSVLTTVAGTDSSSLFWNPQAGTTWKEIDGSDYSVLTIGPTSPESEERRSLGVKRSSYGYCDGKSAALLIAKWDWENKECVPTSPVPGDGLDNDCDGQIDEDTCTMEDIVIKFDAVQDDGTGQTTFKTVVVKGASPVQFRVKSCGIATVALQRTGEPFMSYTAHISTSNVHIRVCSTGCIEDENILIDAQDCSTERTYTLIWEIEDGKTTHQFLAGEKSSSIEINQEVDYDVMFITAFSKTASFAVDMPEKDCSKIITGDEPDNRGLNFVVPVASNDQAYVIFLINPNSSPVDVPIPGGNVVNLEPYGTETVNKNIYPPTDGKVLIEANNEISVYVLRKTNSNKVIGHPVLPNDILGPSYHLYVDTVSTGTICSGFKITDHTESNVGPVTNVIEITKTIYDNELGHQKLLIANRPIALFCGADDNSAQMPPRETLGKQHYIPPLQLTEPEEQAVIHLVATEDSTVVIIKGNYDNLDTVELTGNVFTRKVVPNMLYDIWSTKPIQVHLQIRSSSWSSVVVVPPVEQYKSQHFFPAKMEILLLQFTNAALTLMYITAVNETGGIVTINNADYTFTGAAAARFDHGAKTFSLAVFVGGPEKFIIPSDVMYNDTNKVCKRTTGLPGDGVDNDCDGLIDEEQCTVDVKPGNIDVDIDGSPDGDCAINTTPLNPTTIDLNLTPTTISCPENQGTPNSGNENGDGKDGGITIDNGVPEVNITPPAVSPEKAKNFGSEPSYEPIAKTGGSVSLPNSPTTTAAPGSTSAPVETCVADCVCPCGWVFPAKNYTPEQLEAVVVEIQEKLKVSKLSLSATIRSKSSAKDDRTEATAVGIVGIVFLVVVVGGMVLLDVTTIARDVRMLVGNLRQVFQP